MNPEIDPENRDDLLDHFFTLSFLSMMNKYKFSNREDLINCALMVLSEILNRQDEGQIFGFVHPERETFTEMRLVPEEWEEIVNGDEDLEDI